LIYLDTSLVVSLFSLDANSAAAARIMQSVKDTIFISTLVELEAVNAIGLKEFRKEITGKQAQVSLVNLANAIRAQVFQLRSLPEPAFERARQLSRQMTLQLGTRSADILHVAAALEMSASHFFSFDLQQRKMAEAAGLKLNPLP
jgi:predicted nucleic acid-binding protein